MLSSPPTQRVVATADCFSQAESHAARTAPESARPSALHSGRPPSERATGPASPSLLSGTPAVAAGQQRASPSPVEEVAARGARAVAAVAGHWSAQSVARTSKALEDPCLVRGVVSGLWCWPVTVLCCGCWDSESHSHYGDVGGCLGRYSLISKTSHSRVCV